MNGWSFSEIKPDGARDWVKEANYWFKKYLAVRKRNRNLTYQNRQLRKALYNILKEK